LNCLIFFRFSTFSFFDTGGVATPGTLTQIPGDP